MSVGRVHILTAAWQGFYLGSQANGDFFPELLRRALDSQQARQYWDADGCDAGQLARVLTLRMLEDSRDTSITAQDPDTFPYNPPLITVNTHDGLVEFRLHGDRDPYFRLPFQEFCALTEAGYPAR